jgi:hypothetical protein
MKAPLITVCLAIAVSLSATAGVQAGSSKPKATDALRLDVYVVRQQAAERDPGSERTIRQEREDWMMALNAQAMPARQSKSRLSAEDCDRRMKIAVRQKDFGLATRVAAACPSDGAKS